MNDQPTIGELSRMDTKSPSLHERCYQRKMEDVDTPQDVLAVGFALLFVVGIVFLAVAALVWVGFRLFA